MCIDTYASKLGEEVSVWVISPSLIVTHGVLVHTKLISKSCLASITTYLCYSVAYFCFHMTHNLCRTLVLVSAA